MHYKNKATFIQIGFFILFICLATYFGNGGDSTYIPYIIFFGPFALPLVFSQLFEIFNFVPKASEFFILIISILNILLLIAQPIVYTVVWRKTYNGELKKKYCKYLFTIHSLSSLILILIVLKDELERLPIFSIIFAVLISTILFGVYWGYYLKSKKG